MGIRVLVATTTWWPSVGVLASALEQAGFDVAVLCPVGHVALQAMHFAAFELDRHRPAGSLADTLRRVGPHLVLPADERVLRHLREIHAAQADLRGVVERSIGPAACHDLLTARVGLAAAAAEAGFDVPTTRSIRSERDLADWLGATPAPWVLKADGAWGGEGVRLVGTPERAHRAFHDLRGGMGAALALKRRWLNGDPMPWQERGGMYPRAISVQRFVAGRPATCALFARAGEVLGATMVEAVETCGPHGPATLMRAVERSDVIAHARRLVRDLGLSGFLGLDFLLGEDGRAWLLEMNARLTAACRLRTAGLLDPVSAAAAAFGCRPRTMPPSPRTLFASFPLAWLENPGAPDLLRCRADVPWREPALVREALRPLWPERGMLAFLPARLRGWRRRFVAGPGARDPRLRPFAWWRAQACLAPEAPDSEII